jgi:hypothetical protein
VRPCRRLLQHRSLHRSMRRPLRPIQRLPTLHLNHRRSSTIRLPRTSLPHSWRTMTTIRLRRRAELHTLRPHFPSRCSPRPPHPRAMHRRRRAPRDRADLRAREAGANPGSRERRRKTDMRFRSRERDVGKRGTE